MVLPRPALVNQLQMVASAEGKRLSYLLVDHSSGVILRLSAQAAQAFAILRQATLGGKAARGRMTEEDARLGFAVLNTVKASRPKGRKPFNPLFTQLELLQLAPIQRHLELMSRYIFSRWMLMVLALALAMAAVVAVNTEFAIGVVFQNALTLKVLAAIVFIAPILRLIHETGHLLAATRFGVRGRMGGVFLIGLYPMPFVDLTEADISASRHQRILISAAGILTDLTIGLVAFFVWHLSEMQMARDIAGYVFVVSTIWSLLFNLNPLIRMDGYYVLADALGRRNLATDGQLIMRRALNFAMSAGSVGDPPGSGERWAYLAFAFASFLYRLVILFSIVFAILPRFFGLGLLVALWGGTAMFGPIFRVRDPALGRQGATARQKLTFWGGLLILVTLLMFVPVSSRTHVLLSPEVMDHYTVTSRIDGFLREPLRAFGSVKGDDKIADLSNAALDRTVELGKLAVEEGEVILQVALGAGALQISAAEDRLAKARDILALSVGERDSLLITAPEAGVFLPYGMLPESRWLSAGAVVGQLLPQDGPIHFSGHFPETMVEAFERGVVKAELWTGKRYIRLDPDQIDLLETISVDANSLERGFSIRIAASSETHFPQMLVRFHPIPVWMHIRAWANRKIAALREAQISDIINNIER